VDIHIFQGYTKKVDELKVNLDVLTFNADLRAFMAASGTTKQTEVGVDHIDIRVATQHLLSSVLLHYNVSTKRENKVAHHTCCWYCTRKH
jgi:hypothetical protein